ncbi:hypothetical protein SNE40_001611 [Patella caerulea]|uniref:DUF7869 domain-containing protein n=1 Tax=Patella caerulea TaxID=87958 RepID=A0AAN8KCV8_PATCE
MEHLSTDDVIRLLFESDTDIEDNDESVIELVDVNKCDVAVTHTINVALTASQNSVDSESDTDYKLSERSNMNDPDYNPDSHSSCDNSSDNDESYDILLGVTVEEPLIKSKLSVELEELEPTNRDDVADQAIRVDAVVEVDGTAIEEHGDKAVGVDGGEAREERDKAVVEIDKNETVVERDGKVVAKDVTVVERDDTGVEIYRDGVAVEQVAGGAVVERDRGEVGIEVDEVIVERDRVEAVEIEVAVVDEAVESCRGIDEGVHHILGKKRKRSNRDNWKRNIAKKKKVCGEAYANYKNKIIPQKTLKIVDCRKKCFATLKEDANLIFEAFHKMGNSKEQNQYLFGLIDKGTHKQQLRSRNITPRDRSCPFKYHVNLMSGERCQVCFGCFLHVHGIDRSRVRHLMDTEDPTSPNSDKRGKHTPVNKTPETTIIKIKSHIASFGPQKSHYSPKDNPNKRYLPANLNIKRMWKLYLNEHEPAAWEALNRGEEYYGEITERKYRKVFNEYSLSFGYPRTDTCGTCDLLEAKIYNEEVAQKRTELEEEKRRHVNIADQSYAAMKRDRDQAKLTWENRIRNFQQEQDCSQNTVDMYSFDYQQNLMVPNLKHGEMYYSRQLNVYNFGVHDHVNEDGIMCIYPETVAKKGGAEVASCLKKVLWERKTGAKHCVFYSDGCGGQNRNHDVVCFFQSLIQNGRYKSIDHKFLVRGHTRLANDRDFGLIQQRIKVENVITPSDYKHIIESARFNPSQFSALEMNTQDFFDYRKLSKQSIKTQFKDENGINVAFSKVRWFSYGTSSEKDWSTGIDTEVDHITEVWCRYTLDCSEEWKKVQLLKRNAYLDVLEHKYTAHIKLKRPKWNDICKQIPYIADPVKRQYFELLAHETDEEDDVSEYCDDSD